MFTISIVNRKGGSGKTTTAVNLASQLSIDHPDKQVLLIDLDTQNHAQRGLGQSKKTTSLGIHKIFTHLQHNYSGMVQSTQWKNLSFIPADEEAMENNLGNGFYRLKHFLARDIIKQHFDFIIIDTPPNHGSFLINSLAASDAIIISFIPQSLDQTGVEQMVKLIKRHAGSQVKMAFLPTMLKSRTKHHNQTLANLVRTYGTANLLKGIRAGIQLAEAFEAHQPIQHYAPKSRGAYDYHMLLNELKLIWPESFKPLESAEKIKSTNKKTNTTINKFSSKVIKNHPSHQPQRNNVFPFKKEA